MQGTVAEWYPFLLPLQYIAYDIGFTSVLCLVHMQYGCAA